MTGEAPCPLCGHERVAPYYRDALRPYLQCLRCRLVFVSPAYRPSLARERSEYDLHQNDVHDPGYRRFLSRVVTPLLARLPAGARGLDFGCGPGPALAAMLEEAGYSVALYDPYYRPDPAVLEPGYDFICATEVVEHLHHPGRELDRLWRLLAPGGVLGIMTKLVSDRAAFAGWHYKNDVTHVCFFSRDTWAWWADAQGANVEFHGADVILLDQPGSLASSIEP
jgi:SAM-dependent methyltransferase